MKQILLLFLFITVQGYTQWTNDNLNETTNTFYGRAVSISGDGTVLAVGTYFDGAILDEYNNLDGRGSVSIYKKDETNTWIETTNIVSENIESVGGHFGYSLSLNSDGTVLVIGAPLAGNGQILNLGSLEYTSTNGKGFVSVYTKDESDNWSQVGGDIIGENDNEYFGWSVSISDDGNTIASGGYGYDNESGIARIYKKDDTTNNWIKSIEFNGIEQGQRTGFSLSLSGDGNTLAVGANKHDSDKGSTSIYRYDNNNWNQIGLDIDGETAGENSGVSVNISENGNTLAIGAYNYNNLQGTVRIYKYENNDWSKSFQINGTENNENEILDHIYLTSDANTIAISSISSEKELIRVYKQNNDTSWVQKGDDVLTNSTNIFNTPIGFYGSGISLTDNGDTLITGTYNRPTSYGSAYSHDHGEVQMFNYQSNSLSNDNVTFDDIIYSVQNKKVIVNSSDIYFTIYDLLGRETVNDNLNGVYILKLYNESKGYSKIYKIFIK